MARPHSLQARVVPHYASCYQINIFGHNWIGLHLSLFAFWGFGACPCAKQPRSTRRNGIFLTLRFCCSVDEGICFFLLYFA